VANGLLTTKLKACDLILTLIAELVLFAQNVVLLRSPYQLQPLVLDLSLRAFPEDSWSLATDQSYKQRMSIE
jgi:hypothetical protein